MDKFTAKRLMDELALCYRNLKNVANFAGQIEDSSERGSLVQSLMLIAGELEDGPIQQIIDQHPDLKPRL